MTVLRRFFEWYLGFPAAEAGERTDWRLELQPPAIFESAPALAFLIMAGLAVCYLTFIYRRDAVRVSRGMRATLIGLRLSSLALVFLCLFQATISAGRVGLPVIALMIDDSASMGVEDRYADEDTRALAAELAAESPTKRPTRLALTQSILTRDDGRFLKQILKHHVVRLYHFADTAAPLSTRDLTAADDVSETLAKIRALKAEGMKTRPGPALRRVLDDFRGSPPAAVVMFSDGVSTNGDADRLSKAAEAAAATFVPIDPVGIGSDQPARDVQLYDVASDELAFVSDPYDITGKIKAEGFAGRTLVVRLIDRESSAVLAETSVPVTGGRDPVPFALSFIPTAAGERELLIETPAQPEETNAENNKETRHVRVRAEKIRVLLADRTPRWEFRYLKSLLERDPTISLQTLLQEAGAEYASEDQTALAHFPLNKDDLFRYDVLILGDLDPSLLGGPTLTSIRSFVRESGGGVLFIAGPEFNPLAYRGTPLGDLVPLELGEARPLPDESLSVRGFRPELTIDGLRGTSIFRLAPNDRETATIWNELPELYWVFGTAPMKPGARAFVTRGKSSADEGTPRSLPGVDRNPSAQNGVIVMQPVGAGKVLFHATDEFWRWRLRVGDRFYGPLWTREIRSLSRSRALGRDRTAELTADRVNYSQGESPSLRVRFFDERFVPQGTTGVTVEIERRNGERRSLALSRAPGQSTVFEGQASGLGVGAYHAWVSSPSFREAPPATDFRIESSSDELVKTDLDRRDLQETAERSRGVFSTLDDALDLPSRIPPGHPVPLSSRSSVPLWNRWEMLVLFAGLIVAEWILRKRARLI